MAAKYNVGDTITVEAEVTKVWNDTDINVKASRYGEVFNLQDDDLDTVKVIRRATPPEPPVGSVILHTTGNYLWQRKPEGWVSIDTRAPSSGAVTWDSFNPDNLRVLENGVVRPVVR